MLKRAPDTITAYYVPEEQDPMLRPYLKEFMLNDDEFDWYMAGAEEVMAGYNENVGPTPEQGIRFTFPISEYVIEDAGIQRTLDEISLIKPIKKSTIWSSVIKRILG